MYSEMSPVKYYLQGKWVDLIWEGKGRKFKKVLFGFWLTTKQMFTKSM